jgi:hypothetical protein|tara:strand:+ start:1037 stop:1411 length:375 start_codon:yes stop_codon:yes gene_type:complete
MILTESTFLLFASKHYDNPQCSDISEFEEDLKRFQYLRKLFGRYRQDADLKERLILNHLIIVYNVFGPEATNMLFMKLHEFHDCLKPFVEYLNYMPAVIQYDDVSLSKDNIDADKSIEILLKGI